MLMRKETTLSKWLIQETNSEAYRAGRLSGWKHPKVDSKLINEVGGMSNLLQQAKELETQFGNTRFKPDWRDMKTDIRTIDYAVSIIPELCVLEGIEDTRAHQLRLIETVQRWKAQVREYEWILPYYEGILRRLEQGKTVSEAEDENLFQCLNAIVMLEDSVWERKLSSDVFHDSKKFAKSYKGKIVTVLSKYSPYYVEGMDEEELLAVHNVHSYAQTLEWKGPMQYLIDETVLVDTSVCRYGTILNSQTIEHSKPYALPGVKKIITIENKANYEKMAYSEDTLYIFCHGYFTKKEVRFLRKLCDVASEDCEFWHWGDLDFGGISIFQFNKKRVFPKLMPYKMDVLHFESALEAGAGIPLKESTREKLEVKDAGVLRELKEIILESNMVIEQETFL